MAPDAATQDRIYHALKRDLMALGHRPRTRIDLQAAADRYRASTTPVREAIHRLIGERLVEPHSDGGFQLAMPDATQLLHLYAWNSQHLLSALHVASPAVLREALGRLPRTIGRTPRDQALVSADVFLAIGGATGNSEFVRQIEAANDRLTYPRIAEALLFTDLPRELRTLTKTGDLSTQLSVRRRIMSYHRRRIEHVSQIAHILATANAL